MSLIDDLRNGGWETPSLRHEEHIHSYSTTGDILAYKRCRRQYGFFGVRGFASASTTQLYFGTLVHDVLDQLNRDYQINPVLADEETIKNLVEQAHDRLVRSGIRAYNPGQQKERAVLLIHRFVQLIGPAFFKNVRQTEYRLERALSTPAGMPYVLEGIVDVLAGSVAHDLGLHFSTDPDDVEIWDYKSGKNPGKGSPFLKDYEYQMRVYSELYHRQTGVYPARSVLIFMGDFADEKEWELAQRDPSRHIPNYTYVVTPNPKHIDTAMNDFHQTVEAIEKERALPYPNQWAPPTHEVDKQTCEVCELRYSCTRFADAKRQRNEGL